MLIRSMDTEATGVDVYHSTVPYLVTFCDEDWTNSWFSWDVVPDTRGVHPPKEDIEAIIRKIEEPDILVLQNPKYDVSVMLKVLPEGYVWPWYKTRDTLIDGHMLASNHPHDLNSMAVEYLAVDISKYEDEMMEAVQYCRRLVKRKDTPLSGWRIAEAGLHGMPSVKKSASKKEDRAWKNDCWLPRAVVYFACHSLMLDLLPDDPQQPSVGRVEGCTVRIDRGTKWGNPFVIGKDGDRADVIRKYVHYIWNKPELLADLPELYGQRLGCHCSPNLCHGEILRALCHPWMTITEKYANTDSAVTLGIYQRQQKMIAQRKLRKISAERQKLPEVFHEVEQRGVTLSGSRLAEMDNRFKEESQALGQTCLEIAKSYGYELTLPKSGNNKSLTDFIFNVMKLPIVSWTDTGNPQLNKDVIEHYQETLPQGSKELQFINSLRTKRRRDTAIGYMDQYRRFMIPVKEDNWWVKRNSDIMGEGAKALEDWYILHPNLNITGTDTLRNSSNNPNEQNISKQEDGNLRYIFGPAPGREWWSLDAKNIELRIPAYEAQEAELIDLFERPDEAPYYGSTHLLNFHTIYEDIWDEELDRLEAELKSHEEAFNKIGPSCKKRFAATWYQWCKNGGFAVQYGAVELLDRMGTADRAFHRQGAHAKLKARFARLEGLNQRYIQMAERLGYVTTIPDRDVDPDQGYPLLCTRSSYGKILATVPLNYHTQSTAMWWTQRGMVRCKAQLDQWRRRDRFDGFMTMQVHDEIVFDFPRGRGSRPWLTNLPRVRRLADILSQGGEAIGVPTPVGAEYHAENWGSGITLSLAA